MSQGFTDKEIVAGLAVKGSRVCNQMTTRLLEQNSRSITHYIMANNGSREDAEEVVQETVITFVKQVWEAKFELRDDTKVSTYLFAVAKKIWLKKLEKNKKRSVREDIFNDGLSMMPETVLALDQLIIEEDDKSLIARFGKLGETCKEILRLYYGENKSMEEIAQIMDFPNAQAAKARKYRCMQEFRKLLSL